MEFIHLWKLNKRINSTLLPKMDEKLYTGAVALKAPTSVDEPIFVLSLSQEDLANVRQSNYAMYGGQYYWITSLIQISNTNIEISCRIDVLATYKTDILNTTAYVAYSTSGNTQTADDRLMPKNSIICNSNLVSTSDIFTTNPELLIEITNIKGSTFNTPYLLTGTEATYLKQELNSSDFLSRFKQWFDNPMENFIAAHYCGCNVGNLDQFGSFEEIYVGDYKLKDDLKGHRFDARKVIRSIKTLEIPWNYTDFRKRKPYSIITLFLPFIGIVTLDSASLYESNSIVIEILVEVLTGNIIYNVSCEIDGTAVLISTYSGCCNSNAPIAQIKQVNPIDLTLGAAITAAGAAAEIPIVAIGGIRMGLEALQQHTQINGTMSSMLGTRMSQYIYIYVWSQEYNSEPSSLRNISGLPYYSTVELRTLSGYCQCINASVKTSAMEKEIKEINNFLNGGVYLE